MKEDEACSRVEKTKRIAGKEKLRFQFYVEGVVQISQADAHRQLIHLTILRCYPSEMFRKGM